MCTSDECEQGCHPVNNFMCPTDGPSPIFATFCTVANIALGLTAIIVLALDGSTGCTEGFTRPWTAIMIAVALANFIFGIYLYFRFSAKLKEGKGVAESAFRLIFCDVGNFFYMGAVVFQIVWVSISSNLDEVACDNTKKGIPIIVTIDIIYLVVGCLVLFLSFMTACCKAPRWASAPTVDARTNYEAQPRNPQYRQQQPLPPQQRVGQQRGGWLHGFFTEPAQPQTNNQLNLLNPRPPAMNPDF